MRAWGTKIAAGESGRGSTVAGNATVVASATRALLDEASRANVHRAWLLSRANLREEALHEPEARVSRDAHLALWAAIDGVLGRPDIGLRFAESVRADAFGTLGFLAMASDTVRDALECIATHHRLVKDGVSTRLVGLPDAWMIEELPTPGQPRWPAVVVEYALATYVVLLRQWTKRAIRPRVVLLPHVAPRRTEYAQRFFGCEVRFEQPHMGLVFGDDTLRLPLVTAQPGLRGLLTSIAQRAEARIAADGPSLLLADVRRVVAERLAEGDVRLELVAHVLQTSPRTLQRHLGAIGVRFHAVVDDVRRTTALPLLTGSRVSIEEIGERLGYAETAAFRRAFKRWTGVAPSAIRRNGALDAHREQRPLRSNDDAHSFAHHRSAGR